MYVTTFQLHAANQAMRSTGYAKAYKPLCSAVIGWFSTAVIDLSCLYNCDYQSCLHDIFLCSTSFCKVLSCIVRMFTLHLVQRKYCASKYLVFRKPMETWINNIIIYKKKTDIPRLLYCFIGVVRWECKHTRFVLDMHRYFWGIF